MTEGVRVTGVAIGIAIGLIVAFVLGLIFGVLGCVGVIQFVQWMRGKSLLFTPWPRVYTDVANHTPTVNNPTYELDKERQYNDSTSALNSHSARETKGSSSILAVLEGGASRRDTSSGVASSSGGLEVYEAVKEPINEEEFDLEAHHSHTLPYAVHAYPDDGLLKDTPKPVVFKKSSKLTNISRAGKQDDQGSSDGGKRTKMLAKLKPCIPSKPSMVKSPVHGTTLQLDSDPRGAYSELDKKMSYATLEPHIGESTVVTKGDAMRGENYNILSH